MLKESCLIRVQITDPKKEAVALMHKMQSTIGTLIILLLFLLLGLLYSYYTPLWNPPDEERHFAYCEYIAQNHKLPVYQSDPEKNIVGLEFHPPLYYLIGSLFCKDDGRLLEEKITVNDGPGFITIVHPKEELEFPYSGKARSAHLLRLFSLALSALSICLVYLIVLKIFPGEIILASATTLFVAPIPQFLHISASISNDNIATTFSTAYLLSLLYYLENPFKLVRLSISGILLGFCLLSKSFTLFYVPVTICIIVWICFRYRKNPVKSLSVILCMVSLVSGWWYLRNWSVSNDPLLTKTVVALNPWFLRLTHPSLSDWQAIALQTFTSFFGYFGTLQFSIQKYHLLIYGGITLFGIIGFCCFLVKRTMTEYQSKALGVCLLSFLGGVSMFVFLNTKYAGLSMGRYLFIVISPFAILMFVGFRSLLTPRWRNPVLIALSILLIILNLDLLFRVIKPAYAEISLVAGTDQPIFCCPSVEIKRDTTIAQTFVSPGNNLCAIRVMFSSLNKPKRGEILFSLMEERNTGKVLRQIKLPLREINDFTRYFFTFPPIQQALGKEYTFSFSFLPSLSISKGTSLWYESSNPYPGGSMLINGTHTAGDLYFTTYHFTGEHPQTDWEGKKLAVIKQEQYITFREWQLYCERSKDFRKKTITHEKLGRFQEAIKYRKSMIKQGQ